MVSKDIFTNLIIPKEMIPFENERCIGIKYYTKIGGEEWETGLVFIDKKFVKKQSPYIYKVGIVKTWTYTAKTSMGMPINIPASDFIFFLLNERKHYGGR